LSLCYPDRPSAYVLFLTSLFRYLKAITLSLALLNLLPLPMLDGAEVLDAGLHLVFNLSNVRSTSPGTELDDMESGNREPRLLSTTPTIEGSLKARWLRTIKVSVGVITWAGLGMSSLLGLLLYILGH
jgi:membrane-associated protease RseP (regulator of RpoE activity)